MRGASFCHYLRGAIMPGEAIQKYRLMIGTPISGTLICIGAVRDEDAVRKAEKIVAELGVTGSSFRILRANGTTLSIRSDSCAA